MITKLGICIDIVEIWFMVAIGQILSIFDSYLPMTHPYFVSGQYLEIISMDFHQT